MKKFVKVFVGSRGIIEEVEVVKISYDEIEQTSSIIFQSMIDGEEDDEDREEMEEYVEEFCTIDVDKNKGVVFVGLNEEECEYWIDCDMYGDDCEKLVELFESGKESEFNDLMSKFW